MATAIAKTDPAASKLGEAHQYLTERLVHIRRVLPEGMSPERFQRIVLTSCQKNPDLLDCDRGTLFLAVMQAAALGLEPDSPLSLCHLIPYKGKVALQMGFRGLMELARRSGEVTFLSVGVVHERDEFTYREGLSPVLEHTPRLKGDRGAIYAAYSIAMVGNVKTARVVDQGELLRARQASQGNVWSLHEDAMAMKTAIKRHCKLLPASEQLARALELDTQGEIGEAQRFDVALPAELQEPARQLTPPPTPVSKPKKAEPAPVQTGVPFDAPEESAVVAGFRARLEALQPPQTIEADLMPCVQEMSTLPAAEKKLLGDAYNRARTRLTPAEVVE